MYLDEGIECDVEGAEAFGDATEGPFEEPAASGMAVFMPELEEIAGRIPVSTRAHHAPGMDLN